MTRLLQVSDLHFGRDRSAAVDALVALHRDLQPDVVVLSGDLTQRATHREFLAARALADRLAPSAILALAGNHDIPLFAIWTRLLRPYARYRRHFGSESGFVHETDDLLLIGLNSARHLRHKDGEIDPAQRSDVARTLAACARPKLKVVVLHHPVHAVRPQDEANLVHGGGEAVPLWSAAGADLIVGGHIHLPYVSTLRKRYPTLQRPCWAIQAGTAVSTRTRGGVPNSVNVIDTVDACACRVSRWDFEAGSESFQLYAEERLPIGESAADKTPIVLTPSRASWPDQGDR